MNTKNAKRAGELVVKIEDIEHEIEFLKANDIEKIQIYKAGSYSVPSLFINRAAQDIKPFLIHGLEQTLEITKQELEDL